MAKIIKTIQKNTDQKYMFNVILLLIIYICTSRAPNLYKDIYRGNSELYNEFTTVYIHTHWTL